MFNYIAEVVMIRPSSQKQRRGMKRGRLEFDHVRLHGLGEILLLLLTHLKVILGIVGRRRMWLMVIVDYSMRLVMMRKMWVNG